MIDLPFSASNEALLKLPSEALQAFSSFDLLSDAVYLIDPVSGQLLLANTVGLQQLKLDLAQLRQLCIVQLLKEVDDIRHWRCMVKSIAVQSDYTFCGHHIGSDGGEFSVEILFRQLRWGEQCYVLLQARSLALRDAVQRQLSGDEPLLNYALNEAFDGMWDWNIITNEVFFSPQLKRMLGYGPDDLEPHLDSWKNNIHADDFTVVMAAIQSHIEGKAEAYAAEYRLANRAGRYTWVRDRGRICQYDKQGRPYRMVGMVHNIDEQKQLEHRLRELASQDDLTGLLNRRAGYQQFEQQLQLAQRHQCSLAVALLDIDFFKRINDGCGHQVGDQVLQQVAQQLSSRLRRTDVLMRWGGEEFLLLMPHTALLDGHHLCQQLRQQLHDCLWPGSIESVTISIGLTALQSDSGTITELIHKADQALYRAKAQGRDRIVISE